MIRLLTRGIWILIVASSIALIGALNAVNPQDYKASVEKLVSDKLGRDITVEDAALEWALPPRIVLSNVRIADRPAGAGGRPGRGEVVRAERLVAELDLIPLTYGRVVAPRVRLERVELALQPGPRPAEGGGAPPAVPVPFFSMLSSLGPALGVGGVMVDGLTVVMGSGAGATTSTVLAIGAGSASGGVPIMAGGARTSDGDRGVVGGLKPGC